MRSFSWHAGKWLFLIWLAVVHSLAAVTMLIWLWGPDDNPVLVQTLLADDGRLVIAILIVIAPTAVLYFLLWGWRGPAASGRR